MVVILMDGNQNLVPIVDSPRPITTVTVIGDSEEKKDGEPVDDYEKRMPKCVLPSGSVTSTVTVSGSVTCPVSPVTLTVPVSTVTVMTPVSCGETTNKNVTPLSTASEDVTEKEKVTTPKRAGRENGVTKRSRKLSERLEECESEKEGANCDNIDSALQETETTEDDGVTEARIARKKRVVTSVYPIRIVTKRSEEERNRRRDNYRIWRNVTNDKFIKSVLPYTEQETELMRMASAENVCAICGESIPSHGNPGHMKKEELMAHLILSHWKSEVRVKLLDKEIYHYFNMERYELKGMTPFMFGLDSKGPVLECSSCLEKKRLFTDVHELADHWRECVQRGGVEKWRWQQRDLDSRDVISFNQFVENEAKDGEIRQCNTITCRGCGEALDVEGYPAAAVLTWHLLEHHLFDRDLISQYALKSDEDGLADKKPYLDFKQSIISTRRKGSPRLACSRCSTCSTSLYTYYLHSHLIHTVDIL